MSDSVHKAMIRETCSSKACSAEYRRLSQRGNLVGGVLMLDVIIIVFLMVVKPTL